MPDERSPELWDGLAASYDDRRPDQGLTDPRTRNAWLALLAPRLAPGPNRVLDVGCGTGSLGLLLATQGHEVTGIDFSPAMVAAARAKAATAGLDARFIVADATAPALPAASLDTIICRQTLWALPDPRAALRNWAALLGDAGRVILVEGRFASGKGMSLEQVLEALPDTLVAPDVADLAGNLSLWGGPIGDQRLLIVATRHPSSGKGRSP